MKKYLVLSAVALAALLGSSCGAFAADLAAPVSYGLPFNWTGFYASGYGVWGAELTPADGTDGGGGLTLPGTPNGSGLGLAAEYDWQNGANGWILGGRTDLMYANVAGSGNILGELNYSQATNWLGDIDFVAGRPISEDGRSVVYMNTGLAWANVSSTLTIDNFTNATDPVNLGYNVGGGFKYAFDSHLITFIELDYYKLGDATVALTDHGTEFATSTAHADIFATKVGVSWKF